MRPRAIAQLTVTVVAPAECLPRRGGSTGMRAERADVGEGVSTRNSHGLSAVRRAAVAELPVRVSPPTPRLAVTGHGTRLHAASGDRDESLVTAHPNWRR